MGEARRAFSRASAVVIATTFAVSTLAARANAVGTPATPQQIAAWTTEILPDGRGLPPGRGSVSDGAALYATRCAACHETAIAPALSGGIGTLAHVPVRTVNSYWPYAPTLFDYVRRAMPPSAPGSLTAEQTYALCAYVLSLDGLVASDAVLDAPSLARVMMPNRAGFTTAPQSSRR